MSEQLNPKLLEATRGFLACRKCREPRAYSGKGAVLWEPWAPPCGWAGLPPEGNTDLVLVALNPGHPIDGNKTPPCGLMEKSTSVTADQAADLNRIALGQYQTFNYGQNSVFHKKSVALARALLWLLRGKDPGPEVWRWCWFTDVFKCSTASELGGKIPKLAFAACRPHLETELEICKPKLVVTLGSRSYEQLRRHTKYRVVGFRHPSNRCPQLHSKKQDPSFAKAASLLKVPNYDEDFFRVTRRHVQDCYFWTAGPRHRKE